MSSLPSIRIFRTNLPSDPIFMQNKHFFFWFLVETKIQYYFISFLHLHLENFHIHKTIGYEEMEKAAYRCPYLVHMKLQYRVNFFERISNFYSKCMQCQIINTVGCSQSKLMSVFLPAVLKTKIFRLIKYNSLIQKSVLCQRIFHTNFTIVCRYDILFSMWVCGMGGRTDFTPM